MILSRYTSPMNEAKILGIPRNFVVYVMVGGFNTLFNLALLNLLMWITGITSGLWLIVLSVLSFLITLAQSYLWNRFWVFKDAPKTRVHRQFGAFGAVAIVTAIVSTGLLHVLVNILGAPQGISPALWVNISVAILAPLSLLTNYVGYRFLVFRK